MKKTIAEIYSALRRENTMSRYTLGLSLSISLLLGQGSVLAANASNSGGDFLAQANTADVIASPIPPIVSGSLDMEEFKPSNIIDLNEF